MTVKELMEFLIQQDPSKEVNVWDLLQGQKLYLQSIEVDDENEIVIHYQ